MSNEKSIPSRLWILGRGFKQVPPDIIDGKILWAHPDGYFVNQYGQRIMHNFAPSALIRRPNMHGRYPIMRNFGAKHCHFLMCITFHGPRPEGYQCDHLNGDILDYSASNLEWVTSKENIRRAKILRALRSAGRDPKSIPYDELRLIMKSYNVFDPEQIMLRDFSRHAEV